MNYKSKKGGVYEVDTCLSSSGPSGLCSAWWMRGAVQSAGS